MGKREEKERGGGEGQKRGGGDFREFRNFRCLETERDREIEGEGERGGEGLQ